MSSALASSHPQGVRVVQVTPERSGHLTLRLLSGEAPTFEGLLFTEGSSSFDAVRVEYESMGARLDLAPGLIVPRDGADRELPALRSLLAPGGAWRLVRHRLERRAVLRDDGERVHAKLFKSRRRAERAARTLALVSESGLPAPDVRGVEPDIPLVLVATGPGRPFLGLLGGDGAAAEAACRAAGAALALLARSPLGASIVERHGIADEFAVIDRWTTPLVTLAPTAHERTIRVVSRLRAASGRFRDGEGPLVPSHRDYYDKQLLVAEGGGAVTIVDWDSLVLADPALDPGNFLAHLALRARQGLVPREREAPLRRAFLDGRGELLPQAADRIHFFEAAALLRLAALYALRPPHAHLAPSLLSAAEGRLE
jgi:aminoglycoside phosphotransferase (APT) family kinase protein